MLIASFTFFPLIRSANNLTFLGAVLTYLAKALASISINPNSLLIEIPYFFKEADLSLCLP